MWASFLHAVRDAMGVAAADPGGVPTVFLIIGQVVGATRKDHGAGDSGKQHAVADAGGPAPADPDFV
jgi:hypothetical protein